MAILEWQACLQSVLVCVSAVPLHELENLEETKAGIEKVKVTNDTDGITFIKKTQKKIIPSKKWV